MIFAETKRPLSFLLSEANFHRSRDTITVASGAGKLVSGTVLGKVTQTGQPATGKFVPSPATGSDGSQNATAILAYPVDATSGDCPAVAVVRKDEVRSDELTFDPSVDDATKKAAKLDQLRAVGILAR